MRCLPHFAANLAAAVQILLLQCHIATCWLQRPPSWPKFQTVNLCHAVSQAVTVHFPGAARQRLQVDASQIVRKGGNGALAELAVLEQEVDHASNEIMMRAGQFCDQAGGWCGWWLVAAGAARATSGVHASWQSLANLTAACCLLLAALPCFRCLLLPASCLAV